MAASAAASGRRRCGRIRPTPQLGEQRQERPITRETGSVDPLVKLLSAEVDKGTRRRFAEAAEARKHAAESVKGRQYVEAYVEFMHYAERLRLNASSAASHTKPLEHTH